MSESRAGFLCRGSQPFYFDGRPDRHRGSVAVAVPSPPAEQLTGETMLRVAFSAGGGVLADDSGDHASQVFAGRLLGSVGVGVGDRLYDPLQLAE